MKAERRRPPPGPGRPHAAVVQTDLLGPGSRDTLAALDPVPHLCAPVVRLQINTLRRGRRGALA